MLDEFGMEILISPIYDEYGNRLAEWDETKGWIDFNGVEQTESGAWVQSGVYHPYTDEQLAELKELSRTAQDDTDAMMVDHEYRLTMLELFSNMEV